MRISSVHNKYTVIDTIHLPTFRNKGLGMSSGEISSMTIGVKCHLF